MVGDNTTPFLRNRIRVEWLAIFFAENVAQIFISSLFLGDCDVVPQQFRNRRCRYQYSFDHGELLSAWLW